MTLYLLLLSQRACGAPMNATDERKRVVAIRLCKSGQWFEREKRAVVEPGKGM